MGEEFQRRLRALALGQHFPRPRRNLVAHPLALLANQEQMTSTQLRVEEGDVLVVDTTLFADHRTANGEGVPGGADRRSIRSRANGPGTVIRFHVKEPALTAGRFHRHDLALRAVRQYGRGHRRGGSHAGNAIRQPRDKKTPGAPTPSVPESCWDVWTPEIDPAVAKR